MVDLYPAIDLRGGKVVRLLKGDFESQTTYGDDPVAVACSFAEAGVSWIHVVDLDAARSGSPENRHVVGAIATAVSARVRVQSGGGVRTVADARQLADAGVSRVVMGSAAIRQPQLVDATAAIIDVAVGLDHRHGEVAVDGWTRGAGLCVDDLLGSYPAASAFVITDIERDGVLDGPDVEGLTAAAAKCAVPVIASGGVASLEDIEALASVPGIGGIITGKALYEGRFTVAEALKVLRQ